MKISKSDLVFQSYGRCCNRDEFFVDFYSYFMGSSDAIRQRFVNTDMPAQRHLLRAGILQLVLHARGMSDRKLKALGESHDRTGYIIPPEWYNLWLDALMTTVRKHDPEYTPDLDRAWRDALGPGIEIIRGAY